MKNLKKLGKVLGKKEQMSVNGGYVPTRCFLDSDCDALFICCRNTCMDNSSCPDKGPNTNAK